MWWDGVECLYGARGRNRTGTVFLPRDFKSLASTNFATRAKMDGLTYLIYFLAAF